MVTFQTARPIPDSLHSAKATLQPRKAKAEEPVLPQMRTPTQEKQCGKYRLEECVIGCAAGV